MKKTTIFLSIICIAVFLLAFLIVQNNLKRMEKEQLSESQAISNTLGQNFGNHEMSASGLKPWFTLLTHFTKVASVSCYKEGERIFNFGENEFEKAGLNSKYLSSVRTTVREKGSNDNLDIEILFTAESFYKSKAAIVNMIYLIGGLVIVLLGLIYYTNVINRKLNQTNLMLEKTNNKLEQTHDALIAEKKIRIKMMHFITHDAQNKLVVARNRFSNMLINIEKNTSKEDTKKKILQCHENVETVMQLIKDLKIDAQSKIGEFNLDLKTIEISNSVDNYIEDLKESAALKNQKLIYKPCNEKLNIVADPIHLERIVQNIIRNAMKYSEADTEIEIRIEKKTEQILIHVKDQGKGIPQESWEEIFKSYKRLDQKVEGTGVGLDIARTFLKLMDGNVWVEKSMLGKGTTFAISLPIVHETIETVSGSS